MKPRLRHLYIIPLFLITLIITEQAQAAAIRLEPINAGGLSAPFKIAIDSEARLYVTEPSKDRLLIYNRDGTYRGAINGLGQPLGVAVDAAGRIYIGEQESGSVSVYNTDLSFSHKLGGGDNEFIKPLSIGIDNTTGDIYVADGKADQVKVYSAAGALKFTFGTTGNGNGQFNSPTDIAIDEIKGEILISDLQAVNTPSGLTGGARVQVFDKAGAYKRSFGNYGIGEGMMVRPMGLSVDSSGNIYVSDSYTNVVHIFDTGGNYTGTLYDLNNPMSTPVGVKVGKDERVFIACLNGYRIEVYGLTDYTTMSVSPTSLYFEAEQGGANPSAQAVTISNAGSGTLNWTVNTDSSWAVPSQLSGATGASSSTNLLTGINIAGLQTGTYKGGITIQAQSGAKDTISVNLNITPPPKFLSVAPLALTFKAQKDGPNPEPQTISIKNLENGDMAWTGATSQQWLSTDITSGTAPSTVSVSVDTSTLEVGAHTGTITITAPDAQGSPASVNVGVEIISAGTIKVTTNLSNAGFDIIPIGIGTNYSGTGTQWSYDEAEPGDYTITFRHVTGYIKPVAQTFKVQTGKQVAINAQYRTKPVATNIVAGSGGAKSKQVTVLTLNGTVVTTFEPFKAAGQIKVATGDLIGGSATDEIIITDNKRTIKIYTARGRELTSINLPEGYTHTVIAAGDINNDGKAEIIIGAENTLYSGNEQRRVIKLLSYTDGKARVNALYTENTYGEFNISLADINGDGMLELLIADKQSIRAFKIDTTSTPGNLTQIWAQNAGYDTTPEIAAGDINNDGTAEIALSIEQQAKPMIKILKGTTGEDYGLTIDAYGDLGYDKPSRVALGDIEADGADELITGAGQDQNNDALIRIFESDGTYEGVTITAMTGKFGVNICLGRLQ